MQSGTLTNIEEILQGTIVIMVQTLENDNSSYPNYLRVDNDCNASTPTTMHVIALAILWLF